MPDSADDATRSREWNARAYHTVSEPQFEWGKRVLETLELQGDERVMDAGCGTGRLTMLLAERVPRGSVVAIDRSVNMTRVAQETLAPLASRVVVMAADLSALPFTAAFDVVFSTATFHWVRDHARLFSNLFAVLKPGGRIHAQCGGGANLARVHGRALELAASPEFALHFRGWASPWEYADAETTARRLDQAGFSGIRTSVEPAPVVFPNAGVFRAFITTVVMRPFLAPLPTESLRGAFLDQIVALASRDAPPFMLDYWRLNIEARKGA